MKMGTDMHVAIEIRRNEYKWQAKCAAPTWVYVRDWTVDRHYNLFGAFGSIRRTWSNSFVLRCAENMSWQMNEKDREGYYGFYLVTPDKLKNEVLGWSPSAKDWDEEEEGYAPPVIDKEWFFDMSVYLGDDVYKTDPLNYSIYKLMLKKYGKDNVRLIVYFDS